MVFLDLHNVYDALDRDRFLEILEGYVVGHHAFRILRTYYGRLHMVTRARGYYG